ncbi:Cuticle protein AMP1A, partial [Armadillidium vulgare]
IIAFACLLALAAARPDEEIIEILRDDRVHPEDGKYSFDFETENGIVRSESGSRLEDVENEPVGQQGSVSFTFPNGEEFDLTFVADENGFQPESKWLPVAPEFPHPIPQFVLDQIEKAAREDAEAAKKSS